MTDVRVMVVDDQVLVCEGIASLLGLQEGITVVGTAGDGREAVERALEVKPDVVLMDIKMPVLGGIRAAEMIRDELPSCRVLMLTTFNDEEYVLDSMRAGASGYLFKDLPVRELAQAVRLAHAGVDQHDAAAVRRLVSALDRARPAARRRPDLTEREFDVLKLVARGETNRQIAKELFLSEGTVKNHVSRILNRLGLRDRVQAALHAKDNGWL